MFHSKTAASYLQFPTSLPCKCNKCPSNFFCGKSKTDQTTHTPTIRQTPRSPSTSTIGASSAPLISILHTPGAHLRAKEAKKGARKAIRWQFQARLFSLNTLPSGMFYTDNKNRTKDEELSPRVLDAHRRGQHQQSPRAFVSECRIHARQTPHQNRFQWLLQQN